MKKHEHNDQIMIILWDKKQKNKQTKKRKTEKSLKEKA